MNRLILSVLCALMACLTGELRLHAEEVTATVMKAKGTVEQSGADGQSSAVTTGMGISTNTRLMVGRLSLALYKVGPGAMITQEPQAAFAFTRLFRQRKEKGSEWGVDLLLQRGETYFAIKPVEGDAIDLHVNTSKIEAIAHEAVFKVSHSFSTSIVSVREGIVEVWYCRHTKRILVHPGEILEITDCNSTLRWFNEDEQRQMSLFTATTAAALRSDFSSEFASVSSFLPPVVLAPEVPNTPPTVSP